MKQTSIDNYWSGGKIGGEMKTLGKTFNKYMNKNVAAVCGHFSPTSNVPTQYYEGQNVVPCYEQPEWSY